MRIDLRPETEADYAAVEALTREAFWNVYRPGCFEHYLLHILRESGGYLPGLHLVAGKEGEIVGSIVYSRSRVEKEDGKTIDTLTFGPISVHPKAQRQGIGSLLIRRSLDMARQMGERAVIITGSPDYYHRFGFRPAGDFGITFPDRSSPPHLMALELYQDALLGTGGVYREDAAFGKLDPAAVEAFDSRYPYKEKLVLPGQLE